MAEIINWAEIIKNNPTLPVYNCASPKLRDNLIVNDCLPIHEYKAPSTGKTIWVFIKTKKVQQLLEEWTANNPNKKKGGDHLGT